jgi:hypothetical protein
VRLLVPEGGPASIGRVRRNGDEASGLHFLPQHAGTIAVGAALLGVVLVRLLLRTFKLTLVFGGIGTLAYLATLHH